MLPTIPEVLRSVTIIDMKKQTGQKAILNRRAKFDYELGDELVVGIELTGPEVRAARQGHVHLKGAFVTIIQNQLYLNNASFSLASQEKGGNNRTVDTRARRLLAHRKQIDELKVASGQSGMSILPLKFLNSGRYMKLVIAVGKGKKQYDKRETIKRRDSARDAARAMKNR